MIENYLNISKKYWDLVPSVAPPFVQKRIEFLVKSGYLRQAGSSITRKTFMVIGGTEEYDRGSEMLLEALI